MTDELLAEHQRELESFGSPPRFDIRMVPLLGESVPLKAIVVLASTERQAEALQEVGLQFKRETGYDWQPYDPQDPDCEGVLILSRRFLATFPIVAGGASFLRSDTGWMMTWVWLHPYERGAGLLSDAWQELESRYGQFSIEGSYSLAMTAFLRARQIGADRLDDNDGTEDVDD